MATFLHGLSGISCTLSGSQGRDGSSVYLANGTVAYVVLNF